MKETLRFCSSQLYGITAFFRANKERPFSPQRDSEIVTEHHFNNSPVRLSGRAYRNLRRSVLERDSWRCQSCGTMEHLEVHHIEFRSRSGDDVETNLITLCRECHKRAHNLV